MSDSVSWYVRSKDSVLGPFTSKDLKSFADSGKIKKTTQVRQGTDGQWYPASKVKGLFTSKQTAVSVAVQKPKPRPVAKSRPVELLPAAAEPMRVPCPFCGENVAATAVKCRFCNEYLDGRPPALSQSAVAAVAPAPAQSIVINQVVGQMTRPRWNAAVAVVLSIFIPGLGQMYKGQLLNGFCWLLLTLAGYLLFIVPGLILHVFCVLGAASGDPYR